MGAAEVEFVVWNFHLHGRSDQYHETPVIMDNLDSNSNLGILNRKREWYSFICDISLYVLKLQVLMGAISYICLQLFVLGVTVFELSYSIMIEIITLAQNKCCDQHFFSLWVLHDHLDYQHNRILQYRYLCRMATVKDMVSLEEWFSSSPVSQYLENA
jgi:hypothetical protein